MITTTGTKSWLTGLLAALAASLCCITPLITLLGGISGVASYFLWIAPVRPYLIGITLLILAFAWHRQFSNKPQTPDCCTTKPLSFWQSKTFLLIVTTLSAMLIGFPYYSSAIYGASTQTSALFIKQRNLQQAQFTLSGMGCADCTKHIDGVLSKLPGVVNTCTSFEKQQTVVTYDPKKTSLNGLKSKIVQIGYQVISFK